MYIWQLSSWPQFRWDEKRLAEPLAIARHQQGLLLGRMQALGFKLREEASLKTLTEDALKTSEIEGENLDRTQVRSSIARRLGMDIAGLRPTEHHVDGLVEMLLDATQNSDQPLTRERLFAWHAALFPTSRSGMRPITVGAWRDDKKGPMQVVSAGRKGREVVHFTAPPADRVEAEMTRFLTWFNGENSLDPVLKSALAHLWFVTIHPFEDGNGRISRALADLVLARAEKSPQRFYSMSSQIRYERDAYYGGLEKTQKGDLDITERLLWFVDCFTRAVISAQTMLADIIAKARFWEMHSGEPLNERQIKVLNRLLDGFEGGMTTSKWAHIARCSQDTAYRDILELVDRRILKKNHSRGRSTSYSLATFEDRQ